MRSTTLALGGDVMLGRLVDQAIAARGPEDPWGDIPSLVGDADAFLYNLECAVCGDLPQWRPREKTFHFRLRREHADTILASRVDAVLLANNHAMDHGTEGLLETLDTLDTLGVAHAGAGRTLDEARAPARFRARNGARVSLLGAADHPREWRATPSRPGIHLFDPADPASAHDVLRAVEGVRNDADALVLGLHWGPNMRRIPPATFRAFARRALDVGAHVVWGTSAHLFQGIEYHGDGAILYDTGDLLDDYRVDPHERNDVSFLFRVQIDDGVCREVGLVPVGIHDRRVEPARRNEERFAIARMDELCAEFGTRVRRAPDGVHWRAVAA